MKPIRLTEDLVSKLKEEFEETLRTTAMSDGSITFQKSFCYNNSGERGASILFRPMAYIKMTKLIFEFSTEVAWHAFITKQNETTYVIEDILVYPQMVDGTNVNTDQEAYQNWLLSIDDEQFSAMHCQMHSHVNMGTAASSVDREHQKQIIAQMGKDDFYLFMIWNKRMEYSVYLYDFKENKLFENADVTVGIAGEWVDEFIKQAKELVETKKERIPLYAENGYPTAKDESKKHSKKEIKKKEKEQPFSSYFDCYPYAADCDLDHVHDFDQFIFGNRWEDV